MKNTDNTMNATTIIRTSTTSSTGYELVIIHDDHEEVHPIEKALPTKSGRTMSLVLPENPSNRQYYTMAKVDEAGGEVELTYKASITLGTTVERSPKKPLEDYLDGEDRELYLALVEKAKKAREEAHKKVPLTEEEKLMRIIERETKKLEALRANKKGGEA